MSVAPSRSMSSVTMVPRALLSLAPKMLPKVKRDGMNEVMRLSDLPRHMYFCCIRADTPILPLPTLFTRGSVLDAWPDSFRCAFRPLALGRFLAAFLAAFCFVMELRRSAMFSTSAPAATRPIMILVYCTAGTAAPGRGTSTGVKSQLLFMEPR